jgi:hypothetical protein
MPVVRYFLFVGAVLLALLFVVDSYLPKLPPLDPTNAAAANFFVIRIHSARKWPERVVFDTSLPTITPATTGMAQAKVPAPAGVADLPAKVRVRQAFAQLTPSGSNQLQPADLRKPEAKPLRKRKPVARGYMGPPTLRVAQQPRFGFFGRSIW